MKKSFMLVLAFAVMVFVTGCSQIVTDTGHESVLVDKPYIGTGGVRETTFKPGREFTWFTTSAVPVLTQPQIKEEIFDDLMSKDSVPLDYRTTLQIKVTNPVDLVKNLGPNWYDVNLKKQYQSIVRTEAQSYSMNELLSDPTVAVKMETNIRAKIDAYVKANKLPFIVTDLSIGRAMPNKNVLDQMDLTAAQQQRTKTMNEFKNAEAAREEAEKARAAADLAYREKMSLSPEQFLQLEISKRYAEVCAKAGNCTFVFGEAKAMVNANHK